MRSEIWNCLLNAVSLHAEKENIMKSKIKSDFKTNSMYYDDGNIKSCKPLIDREIKKISISIRNIESK